MATSAKILSVDDGSWGPSTAIATLCTDAGERLGIFSEAVKAEAQRCQRDGVRVHLGVRISRNGHSYVSTIRRESDA